MVLQNPNYSFEMQVATGMIPGWRIIRKFGEHNDLDAETRDVWPEDVDYVPISGAENIDIVSDNAADVGTLRAAGTVTETSFTSLIDDQADFVSAGVAVGDAILCDTAISLFDGHTLAYGYVTGVTATELTYRSPEGMKLSAGDIYRVAGAGSTGAAVLRISEGLDANGLRSQEFIILNGTTVVPTIKQFSEAHRAVVILTGTAQNNVGKLTASFGGTVLFSIPATRAQTQQAIYTIPTNEIGYLSGYNIGQYRLGTPGGAMVNFVAKTSQFGLVNTPVVTRINIGQAVEGSNPTSFVYPVPPVLPSGTRMAIAGTGTDVNYNITAGFTILLRKIS